MNPLDPTEEQNEGTAVVLAGPEGGDRAMRCAANGETVKSRGGEGTSSLTDGEGEFDVVDGRLGLERGNRASTLK